MCTDQSLSSMCQSEKPPKAADMLERARAEAAELRNFTITFLSLLLYVAIIISSTTHEQMLRIDPVNLPLLNVDITIVGFYWFMPGFLLFLHLYILIQHYLFSQLAFRFRSALESETSSETQNHLRRSLGNLPFLHWLAGQCDGFMYFLMTAITIVSLIIWPVGTFWWLQATFLPYHDNTVVWTQRICFLVDTILLGYLWAKILDDQDDAWRWWKPCMAPAFYMAYLIKKVILLVGHLQNWRSWLHGHLGLEGTDIRNGNSSSYTPRPLNPITYIAVFKRWLLLMFLLTALFFSFAVSTLPDSKEEVFVINHVPPKWIEDSKLTAAQKNNHRSLFILTAWLHEQRRVSLNDSELNDYDSGRYHNCDEEKEADENINETIAKSVSNNPTLQEEGQNKKCYWIDSPLPRNLILSEKILVANKDLSAEFRAGLSSTTDLIKTDDLVKAEGLNLQGRHLEYADFRYSSLPNVDMRRARLKAANFWMAKLYKAKLDSAELSGARLILAQLPNAIMFRAKLSNADLSGAKLAGANLSEAELFGADLSAAELAGVNLSEAKLIGSNLSGAELFSADLSGVQLSDAILSGAELLGVDLSGVQLSGTNLLGAELSGVNLSGAEFSGTKLGRNTFLPMDSKEAKTNTERLKNILNNLPSYQDEKGQEALIERMDHFFHQIIQPIDFSKIIPDRCCWIDNGLDLNDDALDLSDLPLCKKVSDSQSLEDAYVERNSQDLSENLIRTVNILEKADHSGL